MPTDLRQRLADGPVICDGAMGTMLYARGVYLNRCYDEVTLTHPDLVGEVHRQYVQAGAEALETNTFGANPVKLARHGLEDRLEELNVRAVEIARAAAGTAVHVLGAMGPLGVRLEPWGPTSVQEARAHFLRQARALVGAGVDGLLLETFGDLSEGLAALEAAREAGGGLPVLVQMTVDRDGQSLYGTTPEVFGAALDRAGADAIGVNCSVGAHAMLNVLERLARVTGKPLTVQPNAGAPRNVDGRMLYLCTPDYLEKFARRFLDAGARLLGGCCGTTPDHIRALAKAVKRTRAALRAAPPAQAVAVLGQPSPGREPPALEARSPLGRALARGERPLLAELTPPRGCDASAVLERAARLKALGVTAINIPDGARASARMSPLALGALMQREVGIPPVLHYCCRDRNLLGMQADLLGAAALGIHDLILITGDPPVLGDYPEATAVFDIDAIGLVNLAARLNHGLDPGGNDIGPSPGFVIGVGLNPTAADMERELARYRWKVEAGAEYAVTQPVFDIEALDRFLDRLPGRRIPVLAGIWPLQSLKNAEFLNTEVPGVKVADRVMERMAAAGDAAAQRAVGLDIALEMVAAVRDRTQGVQVSVPFGRVESVAALVAAVRA
ncbi:MAG: bifunctional homocysteine S-methyltransferase/methylenetetrahydrofolate reductase [Planctomycetia bacterium]